MASFTIPFRHGSKHAPGGTDEAYAYSGGHKLSTRHDWYPRERINTTFALTSQQMLISFFTAYTMGPFTKLGWIVTAPGNTITLARLGLYTVAGNGDLTLVARTANDATLATGTGLLEKAMDATGGFVTSYSPVVGTRYAGAGVVVAAGMPTLAGASLGAGGVVSISPRISAFVSGQSDLPTSIASGTLGNGSSWLWGDVA